MQSLAVLSHKGGTGKTTVATHLAVAAQACGRRTMLVDIDPQRSATAWSRLRPHPGPMLHEARAGTFYFVRRTAEKAGVDLMVVDTAADCEADTLEAVRWADLCVIVVRPSFFDVTAVTRTVEAVKALRRDGVLLLNQTPGEQAGQGTKVAIERLSALGLPMCATRLKSHPAYQDAAARGLVVGELSAQGAAAACVGALWRELNGRLGAPGQTLPLARAAR